MERKKKKLVSNTKRSGSQVACKRTYLIWVKERMLDEEAIKYGEPLIVRYNDGYEVEIVIVEGKADPYNNEISNDNPVAMTLLGQKLGIDEERQFNLRLKGSNDNEFIYVKRSKVKEKRLEV